MLASAASSFLAENVHLLVEGGEVLCLAGAPEIHQACVEGLKEGGVFLLEDEAPKLTKADVLEELSGLHITVATESRGVVRLLGRRPQ